MKAKSILRVVFSGPVVVVAALTLLLLFYPLVVIISGGEDRQFDDQMHAGLNESQQILAANGYCPSAERCLSKDIIFFKPFAARFDSGYGIDVYGVQDQKVLGQIAEVFIRKFSETPKMKHSFVHAHELPHGYPNRTPDNKVIFSVEMKREVPQ